MGSYLLITEYMKYASKMVNLKNENRKTEKRERSVNRFPNLVLCLSILCFDASNWFFFGYFPILKDLF